jgi:ABC-type lipopolysaccharide export system ATPase subunit
MNDALWLANAIDPLTRKGLDNLICAFAAAELRRLHLVEQALERCKAVCDATSEGWRADAEQWQTQRDELLDALKLALRQNEHDMVMTGDERRQCRAAITKAEDEK